MITVSYKGSSKRINAAVVYMNHLFIYPPFLQAIDKHRCFDMADVRPSQLAEVIRYTELQLNVREYFSPKPSHKAYSYDDPNDKRNLFLNRWTLNRPLHSVCNTLMHQCIHALNYIWDIYYFGHGDNNPEGKDNTAPFCIAHFAQQLVANNKKVFETMIHEENTDIQAIEDANIAHVQELLCEEGIMCFHDHLLILGDE